MDVPEGWEVSSRLALTGVEGSSGTSSILASLSSLKNKAKRFAKQVWSDIINAIACVLCVSRLQKQTDIGYVCHNSPMTYLKMAQIHQEVGKSDSLHSY